MWVETTSNTAISSVQWYVNVATAKAIQPWEDTSTGDWYVMLDGTVLNAGPYSTSADALTACRKLVAGVDPSTLV